MTEALKCDLFCNVGGTDLIIERNSRNKNASNEFLWKYFFGIAYIFRNNNEMLWNEFKEEIKHKTRFFPQSRLLRVIDRFSELVSVTIPKDTIFYRAREYTDSDFSQNKTVNALFGALKELLPFWHLHLQLSADLSRNTMMMVRHVIKFNEELRERIEKILEEGGPFWGFDEKNCDAPPKECAIAGRANASGISFLYAAADIRTAVMEMKPQIYQKFNVGEVELLRDVRIFDFTYVSDGPKRIGNMMSGIFNYVSNAFSKPNYGNEDDYLPTQYLCEYLRQKGFDGIRYKSAAAPNGVNIVLFGTDSKDKAYRIRGGSVHIYKIEDAGIKIEQILPFELDLGD